MLQDISPVCVLSPCREPAKAVGGHGCQCCLTSAIDVLITRKSLQENNTKIVFVLLSGGKDKGKRPFPSCGREGQQSSPVLPQDVLEPLCSLLNNLAAPCCSSLNNQLHTNTAFHPLIQGRLLQQQNFMLHLPWKSLLVLNFQIHETSPMWSIMLWKCDTEMLLFGTSQVFTDSQPCGWFGFPFPASPGLVHNKSEAQFIAHYSRNYIFGVAILGFKKFSSCFKLFGPDWCKASLEQHYSWGCIDSIRPPALKPLDWVPGFHMEGGATLLNASHLLTWGDESTHCKKESLQFASQCANNCQSQLFTAIAATSTNKSGIQIHLRTVFLMPPGLKALVSGKCLYKT